MVEYGRQRVIITNISPQVEGGAFPAKGAEGEHLEITADIFGDGHDEIAASVFVRPLESVEWLELPMRFVINDYWKAEFVPPGTGFYQFRVEAWVDHFKTWANGLQKKAAAGQDISVEFEIGARLLESAAASSATDKENLLHWANEFRDPNRLTENLSLAGSNEVSAVMFKYRNVDMVTTFPQEFQIEIERKKAAYSTWYELFPRSASDIPGEHGTFKDVMRLLPRVSRMGFDVLYFPPIHPIGEKNRKGKNNSLTPEPGDPGSPWAIGNRKGGHKAIHPQLGTLADFKKAGQPGVKV